MHVGIKIFLVIATAVVVIDDFFERAIGSVVHVGAGGGDVAEGGKSVRE